MDNTIVRIEDDETLLQCGVLVSYSALSIKNNNFESHKQWKWMNDILKTPR